MEVMFLLIGFSLTIALVFLGLFFWSVRDGQYEDGYTPSVRMLFNDTDTTTQNKNNNKTKNNRDH